MKRHPFAGRWNHNAHYYPLIAKVIGPADGAVLDIGCGDGTLVAYLRSLGWSATGADIDTSLVSAGRFVTASGISLPFADACLAAVTAVASLHHVDAGAALHEMRRVLRPGGTLAVLGLARSASAADLPAELRDALAHRLHRIGTTAWEPDTAKLDPPLTWSRTRAELQTALPQLIFRRLPMWRYLAVWRKPGG